MIKYDYKSWQRAISEAGYEYMEHIEDMLYRAGKETSYYNIVKTYRMLRKLK